jgi:hypothetical protein
MSVWPASQPASPAANHTGPLSRSESLRGSAYCYTQTLKQKEGSSGVCLCGGSHLLSLNALAPSPCRRRVCAPLETPLVLCSLRGALHHMVSASCAQLLWAPRVLLLWKRLRLRRRVASALRARALLWRGARGLRGAALPIRRCAVCSRQASCCSRGHFSCARLTTRACARGALRDRHGSAALPIRRKRAAGRRRGVAPCPVVKCGQPPCRTHARAGTLFDSPPTRETCAQVRGVAARAARRGRSAGERTVPEPCPVSSCARLGSRSDPAAADGCAEWRCGAGVTRVVGACAAACGVR